MAEAKYREMDNVPLNSGYSSGEDDAAAGAAGAQAVNNGNASIQGGKPQRGACDRCLRALGKLFRAGISEFVGTFILVFIGLSVIVTASILENNSLDISRLLVVGLTYGAVYAGVVYSLSYDKARKSLSSSQRRHSIRNLNPALTVCLFFAGRLDLSEGLVFLAAQAGGSACAMFLVPWLLPCESLWPLEVLEGTQLHHKILACAILTLVMVTVIILTAFPKSAMPPIHQDYADFKFFFQTSQLELRESKPQSFHEVNCLVSLVVVTACCVVATPISGDFLNPAFALGVAWVTRSWTWVPFAAPFIASVLGAIVSRLCDAQMNWIAEVFGAAYNSELQAYQQTQKSLAKKGTKSKVKRRTSGGAAAAAQSQY